jgi:hypothetical protein
MANDVKIRFRSFLPGAGFDSAGNPKQGKTRVVGSVGVTSYGSGEPLSAQDVGLSSIDFMDLRVSDATGAAGGANYRQALYVKSVGEFYLNLISSTGVADQYSPAATETLEFVAEGDSAHDIELL